MILTEKNMNAVRGLTTEDKISLVERICDEISSDSGSVPLSEGQKRELDKRYNEFISGNVTLHDWSAVHEDIRNRYK
ncbi:MAG: addiction module protein [Kiritimatiellia bacterium]